MKMNGLSTEDLRAEYHRQDLGKLVRGKYATRVAKAKPATKKLSAGKVAG